jgi:hypothetical protein
LTLDFVLRESGTGLVGGLSVSHKQTGGDRETERERGYSTSV